MSVQLLLFTLMICNGIYGKNLTLQQLISSYKSERLNTVERTRRDTNSEVNLLMITCLTNMVLSLLTLTINYYALYVSAFFGIRRMASFNEKTILSEKLLKKRRFSDELIGKLSSLASFDLGENEKEATTMLATTTVRMPLRIHFIVH
ncbi:hypothetical protein AB6A40_009522 [Gnathostoma spinigerum]|uniref:ABC transmembrane type-1 domain-containing protein n=1 Tax=Gnathostoma spinigerum TaxID=75299 RepID=A0ABD6F028_9BILA